ncbi:hypothetical protein ACP4OV_009393 [Aristida adscensionis]
MAETAVVLALGKLVTSFGAAPLKASVKKEATLLQDLPGTAKRIERELDMIHHFLSQVGTKIYSNKVLEGWIVRVRKVAYCIEDIMDEYCYNIALLQEKRYLKRMIHRTYYANTFRGIAAGMKDIEEEIKHLSQLKRDYREMFNELLNNTSDHTQSHLLPYDGFPHTIKRDDIIGMKKDMELLDRWLDPKELSRIIISVWGFGGLGKTTLVRKVYNWEKGLKSFDCYAWIAVSHNYDIVTTFKQLIRELNEDQGKIPADLDTMHCDRLNDALRGVLSTKRYLIVLDDVWDTRAFNELSDSLIDDCKGSRIIITTRNKNVHRDDCAALFASITDMNHLYSLLISANDPDEPLNFDAFNPGHTQLEKLTIRGCWDNETFRGPVFREYGVNIKYLTLTFCKNDTDPLPSISSSMPNLIFLSIRRGCWAESITLRPGWFPHLKTLYLGKTEWLQRLFIEEGSIPRLEVLLLESLTSLKGVPKGLELVTQKAQCLIAAV